MKSVLVVDDSSTMRAYIIRILKKSGYQVVGQADDGKPAIEMYESLKPDLVTMDVVMKDVDGISATQKIQALDPEARVIVISAMNQQALVGQVIRAGAKDFVVKPFTPSRLREALARAEGTA